MATKNQPEIKKPEKLDLEKARLVVKQLIEENKEWLKEMASR